MNYRAACLSPSIFMGICLLASEFICCAASGRWGASATGGWGEPLLCSTVSSLCARIWQLDPLWNLGTSPALCCHVCPWSRSRYHHLPPVLRVCCLPLLLGQGHHPRGIAVKAEPFHLHSLLIFLSFWLCFRSKNPLCWAPFGLPCPGAACLSLKQSPHQGQEQLGPSTELYKSGRAGTGVS